MATGKPLHIRLFLEGEEVPVISANITIATSSPATASIQVIPLDELLDLKPRTMVHLFFLDTKVDKGVDDTGRSFFMGVEGSYKLLFSGEVVGIAVQKTPQTRGTILQCVDFTTYWDACHAVGVSYGPGGNVFTHTGEFYGANAKLFDDIINDPQHRIAAWLRQSPKTPGLQSVSGLAGGIIRIMEVMAGIPRHTKGVNDFFTVAALRCRLLEQIAAEENDYTAHRLLSSKVFMGWLLNGIQQAGERITIRDLINLLFRYIYYDFVPNPAAKFDSSFAVPTQISFGTTPKGKAIRDLVMQIDRLLKVLLDNPDTIQERLEGPLPKGTSHHSHTVGVAVLYKCMDTCDEVLKRLSVLGRGEIVTEADSPKGFVGPMPLEASLRDVISQIKSTIEGYLTKQGLSIALGIRIKTVDVNIPAVGKVAIPVKPIRINVEEIRGAIRPLLLTALKLVDAERAVGSRQTTQRLRTTIMRPDCWFVSPPQCNVIFPEQYAHFSFERTWIGEATRTLVFVKNRLISRGSGPIDRLLAEKIMTPYTDLAELNKLPEAHKTLGRRVLMKHEFHTGIIPRIEWLPEHTSVKVAEDRKEGSKARISWARAIASFHFFKYRLASRQAQVFGRFNPNLVCGFPCLIVRKPFILTNEDKYSTELFRSVDPSKARLEKDSEQGALDLIQSAAEELKAPRQFVGMMNSLNHNVSQEGGSTTCTLHHVRQHMGADDEFLDLARKEKLPVAHKLVRIFLDYDSRLTQDDERKLNLLRDCTPQQDLDLGLKEMTKKEVVTSTMVSTRIEINPDTGESETIEETIPTSSTVENVRQEDFMYSHLVEVSDFNYKGYSRTNILIPRGSTRLKRESKGWMGKVKAIQVFDPSIQKLPDGSRCFSCVALYEEIVVPVAKSQPVEEVIHPVWFSTSYRNRNIGNKIYEPILGCRAITDQINISGAIDDDDLATINDVDDILDVSCYIPTPEIEKKISILEGKKNEVSIERAVNFISYIYGLVKSQGLDVEDFITDFTYRPIATFRDIFGDSDLEFNAVGHKVRANPVMRNGESVQPSIGFHSMATHPSIVEKRNLVGLLEDPVLLVPRLATPGTREAIPLEYDVRYEKRDRVLAYKRALGPAPGAFRG